MPDDLAFYRSLLDQDPRLASARACLAQALLAAGQTEAAHEEATQAIVTDAALVPAWLTRAATHHAMGETEDAIADYARAARLAPGRPMILLQLAACQREAGRLTDAEAALRQAIAARPDCAEAHANLGAVLVLQGRAAEAEAPCRTALRLDPALTSPHQNLAVIVADKQAARRHRDAAYAGRPVVIEATARPTRRVLVLAAAENGNVPLHHLLPRQGTGKIRWYLDYADAKDKLPPFDLVFNGIGDSDRLPPQMPAVLARLQRDGHRVLNHPDAVARTGRAALPALLADIPNVIVPPTRRSTGDDVAEIAQALGYPVLVRPIGSHGGDGLRRIDTAAASTNDPAYVTKFVEFVSADGWYRKYRMIFVAGRPYPYHLAIARHWLVHHWTAAMEHDPARCDEERRFLAEPGAVLGPAAMRALDRIGQRLALDYAGIDFTLTAEGGVLVFEANATMLVHPEPDGPFTYRNLAVSVIQHAFHRLLAETMGTRGRGVRREGQGTLPPGPPLRAEPLEPATG
jgi:Flp pilus assembly protein TadD